jgi:anti-sigma factor RsiW
MTMQNTPHPDDELLAAYAGGDADALADGSLAAHLSGCDRCRPLVDELSLLRGALAELPDLAPSRPLRLIPPVPAAAVRSSWLRRLTAPAMAAGAGLVLVGAVGVGASGVVGGLLSAPGGAAPAAQEAAGSQDAQSSDTAGVPAVGLDGSPSATSGRLDYGSSDNNGSLEPRSLSVSPAPSHTPVVGGGDGTEHVSTTPSPEQPWLTLLIAGAGLFGISTALRLSLSPRAG